MYDYISPRGNYLLNVLNAKETLTFGHQYRGITYLREVCENMERVIKLPGGIYNFGSETTQSMYEITKEFLRITGSRQQVQEGSAVHNLWMDCGKGAGAWSRVQWCDGWVETVPGRLWVDIIRLANYI